MEEALNLHKWPCGIWTRKLLWQVSQQHIYLESKSLNMSTTTTEDSTCRKNERLSTIIYYCRGITSSLFDIEQI